MKQKKTISIGASLFPKIKRQLFTLFFLSESRHYFREITRLVNASPGTVQRELKSLTEAGILSSEKVGRQKYYWADPECMIYADLKAIVIKTFGVVETVTESLEKFRKDIVVAFVYGSIARSSDTSKSDIDIMIVGKVEMRALAAALNKVEETLMRPINQTLYSPEEFSDKAGSKNHFIRSVVASEKLFIIGTKNDLGRLAQK